MTETQSYYNMKRLILMSLISAGSALIGIVVGSSLMKFYTDIVGLSPAMYGVVFLIFSIWNGANDIFIAYWADRHPFHMTKGKYGRYIRWAIPVIAVSVIAIMFASPGWNETLIAVYLLVLLLIYEGFKTLLDVSFGAFRVNTFLSSHVRSKTNAIATYMNMIPVFIGGMIPVWVLTGEYSRMTVVVMFTAVIAFGIVLLYIGSRFIKEDPDFYKNMVVAKGFKDIFMLFKDLIKDKVFVIYGIAFFLIGAATGNYMSGFLYYMDNVLAANSLQATISDVLGGVVQMASLPFIVIAVKKYGAKRVYVLGMCLAVLGHAMLTLPTGYYFVTFSYMIILGGYGFASVLLGTLGGLLTDHVEIETGKRQPALLGGLLAIFLIPAASFQPLILSVLLDMSGYDGTIKLQTEAVQNAIRLGTGIIPALILILGLIVFSFLPFGFEREKEIQRIIKEKHNQETLDL